MKLAAIMADGQSRCWSKAVARGALADAACLQSAAATSGGRVVKVRLAAGCLSTGGAAILAATVDAFVADLTASLRNAVGPSKCTAAKIAIAGRAARDKGNCQRRTILRGAAVDPVCSQRTTIKLAKRWASAEGKGDCQAGIGDAAAIEAKIDAFIAGVRAELARGRSPR
jgi:hypothetical protein